MWISIDLEARPWFDAGMKSGERMKQPLFPAAALFAGGILAGAVAPVSPWVLLGVCLGLAAVTLVWGRARAALLCLLVFLTGWTNLALHTATLSPNDLRRILGEQPAIVSVRGTLSETPALRMHDRWERESWHATAQVWGFPGKWGGKPVPQASRSMPSTHYCHRSIHLDLRTSGRSRGPVPGRPDIRRSPSGARGEPD